MGQIITSISQRFFSAAFNKVPSITLINTRETKMVFLVRTDLNMGKGKIASQVAHAAIMLYEQSIKNNNPYLKSWRRYGQPKVVLKVVSECYETMNNVYEVAVNNKLNACQVFDAGRTQIDSGSLTVVGIGPDNVHEIDKITKCFKLL